MTKRRAVFDYALRKLSGAGLAIAAFWLFTLVLGGDVFRAFGGMVELRAWWIIYGYGTACSVVIDLVGALIAPLRNHQVRAGLHVLAGLLFFLLIRYGSLLFGIFGAAFALIYYAGTRILFERRIHAIWLAAVIPCVLIGLTAITLNLKMNWHETYSADAGNYEASFGFFNGAKKVPVQLEKGQTLSFDVAWKTTGGSYGHHVLDPRGRYAGMGKAGIPGNRVTADRSGTYHIVLDGDKLTGTVDITWHVQP